VESEAIVSRSDGTKLTIVLRELETVAHPLAQKFYKAQGANNKTNRNDQIFVCLHAGSIVGCLRVAPCESQRLLRGVLIDASIRNLGLGRHLIKYALSKTRFETVWTFPYSHLIEFYKTLGFDEKNLSQTPSEIEAALLSYQKQGRNIGVMVWQKNNKI
jgi:N-acetylglutamate synthase-like GNAT family acetyltransferase